MADGTAGPGLDDDAKQALYAATGDAHGLDSAWDIMEVSDFEAPHPYPLANRMAYVTHGGDGGAPAVVVPISGTRWLDLYIAADQAIAQSGDADHIYIEGFEAGEDAAVLLLQTGS